MPSALEPRVPTPSERAALTARVEAHLRRLTLALYDTDLPPEVVDAEVRPWLDPQVRFVDPWQEESGIGKYRLGLAGFHTLLHFHFDILQLAVTLDEAGHTGRAVVDGVMYLKHLHPLHTYPLRTMLTYVFTVTDAAQGTFLIREHEEMWSVGDMVAAVPGVGWLYTRLFRPGFARAFLAVSWLSSRARGFVVR